MPRIKTLSELESYKQKILSERDPSKPSISICTGTGCLALGAANVVAALRKEIENQGLTSKVDIRETGCPGFCERGTVIVIHPQEICYLKVQPQDVKEVVTETIVSNRVVERLLYTDPVTGEKAIHESDIPFYKNQMRLLMANNAAVDPKSIDDYIMLDGYSALAKALTLMTPEQIIGEVKKSKLRGRGGGGFPTSTKWEETRNAQDRVKYVLVNADEGDPGAFKDRALLEGNPHSILEGLTIGGYAIGAHKGVIYVRQEYPLAVENVHIAIKQATDYGFLGKDIFGSGFEFTVDVQQGAGAYVSGESSALMTAVEGRVGEPRPKYIHTAVKGVWDKPSNLNNVETWAAIPHIVKKGGEWFAQYGTEGSKGTKIFSVVGKVNNTGLVEVPMGITLRDIVFKIGGGIPGGKKFKAIQTGGPSGGCIPESGLDMKVDYDELTRAGSIMGSGGMIVMDEDTCMVDVARYFLSFLSDESCGKCVPCREGIRQMLKVLNDITTGKGKEEDIDLLGILAETTKAASLCGLGRTCSNSVTSTLRYFKDEYDAHIKEKRCPAFVCKELFSFYIDPAKCQACMICARKCPAEAIAGDRNKIHVIDQEKCTKCGTCFESCPSRFAAVTRLTGEPIPAAIPEEARVIVRRSK